ncbi:MAG: hypothetical protein WCP73_02795 [Eubacteriales bacterium]
MKYKTNKFIKCLVVLIIVAMLFALAGCVGGMQATAAPTASPTATLSPTPNQSPIAVSNGLVALYTTVLSDLWNTDDGLNPHAGVLAFDLSQVTNLTDDEKSALVNSVSSSHGLKGITGTFDELAEQGLIDEKNLSFKDGMLFRFMIKDVTESSFTFDVSKWRSGTGAYFFNNCKAVKSGVVWSYIPGSAAIS